jgi:hypothetical protein
MKEFFARARFIEGLSLGILIGLVFVCLCIGIFYSFPRLLLELENYVFATVALLAAWLTVSGINRQIHATAEIEAQRRARSERKNRAQLPFISTDISKEILKMISWYLEPNKPPAFRTEDTRHLLEKLSNCVEILDEKASNDLVDVVCAFQILESRFEQDSRSIHSPVADRDKESDRSRKTFLEQTMPTRVKDLAVLYCSTTQLLFLSRSNDEVDLNPKVSPKNILAPILLAYIHYCDKVQFNPFLEQILQVTNDPNETPSTTNLYDSVLRDASLRLPYVIRGAG